MSWLYIICRMYNEGCDELSMASLMRWDVMALRYNDGISIERLVAYHVVHMIFSSAI